MNKKEFLEALRQALAVLDETEQRDIIDEYEQHIDMKVASGLTEEEAIADFGDFNEMTAELLEAYHVRADYAGMGRMRENGAVKAENTGGQAQKAVPGKDGQSGETSGSGTAGGSTVGNFATGLWKMLTGAWLWLWGGAKAAVRWSWRLIKVAAVWIWKVCLWCWRQVCRPFIWLAGLLGLRAKAAKGEDRTASDGQAEQAAPGRLGDSDDGRTFLTAKEKGGVHKMRQGILSGIWGGIISFCRWCVDVCIWCVRMAWNACCVAASLTVGMMGVFFLFALGMFLILVLGGYPLAGLSVASLGAAVSFFAAAGFVMTLLWQKKRPAAEAAAAPIAERSAEAAAAQTAESIAERSAEAAASQTVESIAERSAEAAAAPAAAPIVAPDAEPTAAPALESSAEPVIPEEPEANGREEGKDHA